MLFYEAISGVCSGRLRLAAGAALCVAGRCGGRSFDKLRLSLEPIFDATLFTLLVLLPPFIIHLYMRTELVE